MIESRYSGPRIRDVNLQQEMPMPVPTPIAHARTAGSHGASRLREALLGALLLALAGPAAAQSPADSVRDPLAGRVRGSAKAPVTVYEMSDFQCPYCRRFALETFPALDSAYVASGRVRWVFINFPLTSIHPNAAAAAEVAVCAAAQNAFWPVHDLLYRYQEVWAPLKEPAAFFLSLADSARISKPALVACLRSPATREQVRADAEGASRSGAGSTPTFYIEGGLLAGAHPLPVFRQVLDSILAAKVEARPPGRTAP
jgi:protein-disulfide isomerase